MHPTRKGAFALPSGHPIDPPSGGGADAAKGSLPALPFGFPIGQGCAPLHRTKGEGADAIPLDPLPRKRCRASPCMRRVNLFLMP